MSDLVRLVARESVRLPPAARQAPLLVAVSGGADSTALLHALARWAGPASVRLHAAHVDHGLRDAESRARDAATVMALCLTTGVPLTVEQVHVAGTGHARSENAARVARYQALAEVAARIGARVLVTGHHADDQVETLLLHLLRGSGASGVRGMRPVRAAPGAARAGEDAPVLWRPLLAARRADIAAYCGDHGLSYSEDATNTDQWFKRNRVRHLAVPALERVAGNAVAAIGRFAETIGAEDDLLDQLAEAASRRIVARHDGHVTLHRGALRSEHLALQRRVLRRAWLEATGALADLYACHIESAREHLIGASTGARLDLPHGQLLVVDHEFGYIGPRGALLDRLRARFGAPLVPPEWSFPLGSRPAAALELPGGRYRLSWCVRAADAGPSAVPEVLLPRAHSSDLVVRTRRPGDVVTLPGGRHRSLQDWLVDNYIPAYVRDRLLLLALDRRVVWIVGVAAFAPSSADIAGESAVAFALWYDGRPVAPVRANRSGDSVAAIQ